MKSAVYLFVIGSLFFTAPAISAEEQGNGAYFGMSYLSMDYDLDGFGTAAQTGIDFRIGNMLNDYVALEGRLGLGLSGDTLQACYSYFNGYYYATACEDVTVELKNYIGVYLKPYFVANGKFRPYAIVGYTRGKLEASLYGQSESANDNDLSFGFGADIAIGQTGTDLNIEYMNLYDKEGESISGFSVGWKTSF